MKTLLEILQASERYLSGRGFASARSDVEWLIAHALGIRRIDLYLQFERPLTEAELDATRPLLRRRGSGEPLQYILGTTQFYNCELSIGPGVLVPRPETERLVEVALKQYSGEGPILDLCTGSGAILFALAGELTAPPCMLGVDISEDALAWARRNREALGFSTIDLRCGDLFAPVDRKDFSLITANPPYVTESEYAILPDEVRAHEPAGALLAGSDGLAVIRRIAAEGLDYLADGGSLVMEIGERQASAVTELLRELQWQDVRIVQDYTRRDRIAVARKAAAD